MAEPSTSSDEPPFPTTKSGCDEFYVTVLNAWRQERTVAEKLKQEKNITNEQVNSLTLQTETLRRLLKSEKQRVKAANSLVKRMVADFQTQSGKRDVFVEEKKRMEEKIRGLELQLNVLETANGKLESALCATTHDSLQLEKRLVEERQQLASIRLEKKLLQEKVYEFENAIAAKNIVIKELDKLAVELQEQLSVRTIKTVAADEDTRFTQLSYEDLRDQQEHVSMCVRKVVSERAILIDRIVILESRLRQREVEINSLARTLDDKNDEIAEMKLQLDISVQQQTDWLDSAIGFLASVSRLPWFLYQYLFSDGAIDSTSAEPVAGGSGST